MPLHALDGVAPELPPGGAAFLAPDARLIPTSDRAARSVVRLLSIGFAMGMWFIAVAPILLGGGLEAPAARALAIAVGLVESLAGC